VVRFETSLAPHDGGLIERKSTKSDRGARETGSNVLDCGNHVPQKPVHYVGFRAGSYAPRPCEGSHSKRGALCPPAGPCRRIRPGPAHGDPDSRLEHMMCGNRRNGGWGGRGLISDKSKSSQPGRQGNRRLEDGGPSPGWKIRALRWSAEPFRNADRVTSRA
jgi:hypothetical protein